MTTIADTNRNSQTDQMVPQDTIQNNEYQNNMGAVLEWKENSPSYLASVQALLDNLTEEDKNAIHASLEEE